MNPLRSIRRANSARAGITIIEILVVTVILTVIVSIAIVSLFNALEKAKQRATMADMRTISRAIEAYMIDHSMPPIGGGRG